MEGRHQSWLAVLHTNRFSRGEDALTWHSYSGCPHQEGVSSKQKAAVVFGS